MQIKVTIRSDIIPVSLATLIRTKKIVIVRSSKRQYIDTMKFCSAMKKNEIMNFAGKWVELENITLIALTQVWKDKHHMCLYGALRYHPLDVYFNGEVCVD